MSWQHNGPLLLVMAIILTKNVATASRHGTATDDVELRRCGGAPSTGPTTDCQSSADFPTLEKATGVKDGLKFQPSDDGRWV